MGGGRHDARQGEPLPPWQRRALHGHARGGCGGVELLERDLALHVQLVALVVGPQDLRHVVEEDADKEGRLAIGASGLGRRVIGLVGAGEGAHGAEAVAGCAHLEGAALGRGARRERLDAL
jgi:hypothetical protein